MAVKKQGAVPVWRNFDEIGGTVGRLPLCVVIPDWAEASGEKGSQRTARAER